MILTTRNYVGFPALLLLTALVALASPLGAAAISPDASADLPSREFSAINAGIYLVKGDYANAALSAVGAVPGAGDLLKGGVLIGGAAVTGIVLVSKHGNKAKTAAKGGGRAGNKLRPDTAAKGAHSTFKRGPDGKISNYATYEPNPKNPSGFQEVKRVDVTGRPHRNPDGSIVPTPHVKEAGTKGVRPAKSEELP